MYQVDFTDGGSGGGSPASSSAPTETEAEQAEAFDAAIEDSTSPLPTPTATAPESPLPAGTTETGPEEPASPSSTSTDAHDDDDDGPSRDGPSGDGASVTSDPDFYATFAYHDAATEMMMAQGTAELSQVYTCEAPETGPVSAEAIAINDPTVLQSFGKGAVWAMTEPDNLLGPLTGRGIKLSKKAFEMLSGMNNTLATALLKGKVGVFYEEAGLEDTRDNIKTTAQVTYSLGEPMTASPLTSWMPSRGATGPMWFTNVWAGLKDYHTVYVDGEAHLAGEVEFALKANGGLFVGTRKLGVLQGEFTYAAGINAHVRIGFEPGADGSVVFGDPRLVVTAHGTNPLGTYGNIVTAITNTFSGQSFQTIEEATQAWAAFLQGGGLGELDAAQSLDGEALGVDASKVWTYEVNMRTGEVLTNRVATVDGVNGWTLLYGAGGTLVWARAPEPGTTGGNSYFNPFEENYPSTLTDAMLDTGTHDYGYRWRSAVDMGTGFGVAPVWTDLTVDEMNDLDRLRYEMVQRAEACGAWDSSIHSLDTHKVIWIKEPEAEDLSEQANLPLYDWFMEVLDSTSIQDGEIAVVPIDFQPQ
ncbi:MAG: hypothetical protein KDI98_03620 [Hyphomicrobiaceae bacterium]|nr:hypothetical protein [Hyphomicrobiaceae bacterium]